MPAANGALTPPQAKNTVCRVALIPEGSTSRPTSVTLTNSGTEVSVTTEGTAEAVTMTLASSVTTNIEVGQWLRFVDAGGLQYKAQVTTKYTTGTSLGLTISESIPAGAIAKFPAEFRIRQAAGLSESVSTNSFSSFDHANSAVSIGEGTASIDFSGGYSHYDAGLATCKYAKDNTQKIFFERELESPDGSVFGSGLIEWGVGVITSIDSPANDQDSVGGNVTIDVSGTINRIEPKT